MGLPRRSILFILLPPDYNGALIVFPCSSSGIHCYQMISVPLSFAVFLTSWAKILEFESARGCVYPLHAGVRSPKPSCTSATGAFQKETPMEECRIVTNSCKLGFFLQCLKILNAFSQSASRCGLVVLWSFEPKDLLLAVSLLSVFDHFVSVSFSEVSSGFKQESSHQQATAPVVAELIR